MRGALLQGIPPHPILLPPGEKVKITKPSFCVDRLRQVHSLTFLYNLPMEKRDAIVVLGNPFMGDEGVGPALLEILRKEPNLPPNLDLIDTGGNILKALHTLSGRRKVLFIDCAFLGLQPGECLRFLPSQVESQKQMARLSLHEGDLIQMIETAKLLGESAEQVIILGIEPERVSPVEGLSPTLSSRLGFYLQQILGEFKNSI